MKPTESIDFHLRWLWLKLTRIYNVEAAKFGGTMSVGYVLLNIDREGTPSTKLGPKMGIESRSLTRTLKAMEENGLITRTTDKRDGRLVLIHLTEDGKKYRDTSREVVIKLNEYLQRELDPEKLAVFMEVSQHINLLLNSNEIFCNPTEKTNNQPPTYVSKNN